MWEEPPGQGFDALVADIRVLLHSKSVKQSHAECTERLLAALQDDRGRARYVVELLVEAAMREALRQRRAARGVVYARVQNAGSG